MLLSGITSSLGRLIMRSNTKMLFYACALETDLEHFPRGDETEIGEKVRLDILLVTK